MAPEPATQSGNSISPTRRRSGAPTLLSIIAYALVILARRPNVQLPGPDPERKKIRKCPTCGTGAKQRQGVYFCRSCKLNFTADKI